MQIHFSLINDVQKTLSPSHYKNEATISLASINGKCFHAFTIRFMMMILIRQRFFTRVWLAQTKHFWSVWSGPTKHGFPRKNWVHVWDSVLQPIGNLVHAPGSFWDKNGGFLF